LKKLLLVLTLADGILLRPSLYTTEVDGVRLVDWIRDLATGKDVADVTCKEACR